MANETQRVPIQAADLVVDVATGEQVVQLARTVPVSDHSVTAAASALLSSLITINANLRALTLKPRTGKTVYIHFGGAASAATLELVAISMTITKAVADTIYVYSADGGPNLDIIQHV